MMLVLRRLCDCFSLSLLPSDASVLECGCGTDKPVSSLIAESGRQPHGIEFSLTMVELSKKQVKISAEGVVPGSSFGRVY